MLKKIWLVSLLFFFCLGQLGRIEVPNTNIVLHLNDLFVGASVIAWLVIRNKKAFAFIGRSALFRGILFWSLAMAVSLLFNLFSYHPIELVTSALYAVRWLTYTGLFFMLSDLFSDEKQILRRGIILAGVVVAATGLLQYILVPDTSFLAAVNWDDHYFRLIGVFLDPGFTGAILATIISLAFVNRKRLVDYFPLALIYSALSLTYSRASYLIYVAIFAMLAYLKKSVRIFVFSIVILLFTILILPKHFGEGTKLERQNSIWARINNWRQSLVIWSDSPIFGVGYDSYRYVQEKQSSSKTKLSVSHAGAGSDSSVLLALATTGIVGFGAYMFLLRSIWKFKGNDQVLTAILPALLIGSFFNNLLFYAWIMELVWVLLATRENSEQ